MRVVAVDPGKTTGLAYMTRTGHVLTGEVFDWRSVREVVANMLPLQIHVEEFRITAATASKTAAPWSLKCYGALETYAWENDILFSHAASTVKSTVTDAHLRAAGLWKNKSPHERDALRHLVLALAKMNDPWAVSVLLKKEEQ